MIAYVKNSKISKEGRVVSYSQNFIGNIIVYVGESSGFMGYSNVQERMLTIL